MGARFLHCFNQLFHNMRRRRHVRIAHAEIDDVAPLPAQPRLQRIDLAEHIRRQPLNAVEFFSVGHKFVDSLSSGNGLVIDYDIILFPYQGKDQEEASCDMQSNVRIRICPSIVIPDGPQARSGTHGR